MTFPYTAPDGTIIDSMQHLDKTLADEYRDTVMTEIAAVLDHHAQRISAELGCTTDIQADAALEAMLRLTAEWIAEQRGQDVNDAIVDMSMSLLTELRDAIPDKGREATPPVITRTYMGRTTYPFDVEVQHGPVEAATLTRVSLPFEDLAARLGVKVAGGDPMRRHAMSGDAAAAGGQVESGAPLRGYDPSTTQVWVDGHLCGDRPIGTPEDRAREAEPPADIRTKTVNQLREEYGLGRVEGGEQLWVATEQGPQPVNDDGQIVPLTTSTPAATPDDESPEPEQTEEPQS